MPKKDRLEKILHIDLWILAAAAAHTLLFAARELLGSFQTDPFWRTLSLLLACLLFYCGGLLYTKRTGDQKLFPRLFLLFFLLYLYLLFSFTLLDPSMGRGENSVYDSVGSKREAYNERFLNLIPFRSIYHVYIKGFLNGYVNTYYTLLNLAGNVCAFMPLAFFLPHLFKLQRRWYIFLPTMLLFVIAVEAIQYLFMIGSCDIDDLILNAGGAFLFFLFLKLPFMKRLIRLLTQIEPKKTCD